MPEHPKFDAFLLNAQRDPRVRRAYRRARAKHAVLDRWRALVCRVRGHEPIRVFDKVVLRDPEMGLFDVTKQHVECYRCGRRLPGASSRH